MAEELQQPADDGPGIQPVAGAQNRSAAATATSDLPGQAPRAASLQKASSDSTTAIDPLEVLMQASAAAESLQVRFSELQTRQAELTAERAQLAADRSAFERRAREFAEQVARDRTEQRQMRAELEHDVRRAQQLRTSVEEEQIALEAARDALKDERQRLQQALIDELASERASLQRLKDLADGERGEIAARRQQLEAEHQDRQRQLEELVNSERQTLRNRVREEFDAEFSQLSRERQEWNDHCQEERDRLCEESENLQQQRELLAEQMESEQTRLRDDLEERRNALLTEQSTLQRRYRFQFEHLTRARNDFNEEVRQLRAEQRQVRADRSRFQTQHRLRFRQLEHVRGLLDEREDSLHRELRVIDRSRAAVQLDLDRRRERLQEHRDAVNRDLQERTRAVRIQEAAIATTNQRMAEKTQHLNRLRTELDAQQRDLLELRIVLEEVQARLNRDHPDADQENHRHQARESLRQFFDSLHQRIREDRGTLEQQAADLERERRAFRTDREELERWYAEHQAALQQPPPPAGVDSPDVTKLQEELDRLRREYVTERTRSETKIRGLLDELAALRGELADQSDRDAAESTAADVPPLFPARDAA